MPIGLYGPIPDKIRVRYQETDIVVRMQMNAGIDGTVLNDQDFPYHIVDISWPMPTFIHGSFGNGHTFWLAVIYGCLSGYNEYMTFLA